MPWFVLLLQEAENLIYLIRNYVPVLVLLVGDLTLSFSLSLRIVLFVLFNFSFPAFSLLGLQLEMFLFLFVTAWLSVVWEDDRGVGNFLNSLALHSLNISLIWIFTNLPILSQILAWIKWSYHCFTPKELRINLWGKVELVGMKVVGMKTLGRGGGNWYKSIVGIEGRNKDIGVQWVLVVHGLHWWFLLQIIYYNQVNEPPCILGIDCHVSGQKGIIKDIHLLYLKRRPSLLSPSPAFLFIIIFVKTTISFTFKLSYFYFAQLPAHTPTDQQVIATIRLNKL